MRKYLFAIMLSPCLSFAVGQAWTDGQNAAAQGLGSHVGSITSSNVQNIGSTYNDPSTVGNLQNSYGGSNAGNVGLGSYGNGKISNCANFTPNPATAAANQECAAVNELANNPVAHAQSVTGITKADPIFTNPNTMVNLGGSSTGTQTGIGSGTPPGEGGSTECITTTTTTPATYTTETCTRASVPSNQNCQVTVNASIETTMECGIFGTVYSDPMNQPSRFEYGNSDYGRTCGAGRNFIDSSYRLDFECSPYPGMGRVTFAPAYFFPGQPRCGQGTVWWASGYWGVYGATQQTLDFAAGVAHIYGPYILSVSSGQGVHNGRSAYLYYDGTDWYVTEEGRDIYEIKLLEGNGYESWNPFNSWQLDDFGFCADGYTYVPTYLSISKPEGAFWPVTSVAVPAHCVSPSDPDPAPTQAMSSPTNCYPGTTYQAGIFNIPGACMYSFDSGLTATYHPLVCPSGTTRYVQFEYGSAKSVHCLKPTPHYYIPDVNPPVDRGLRHYRKVNGTYSGYLGIKNTLVENIADSCATLQANTTDPTITPATVVNGYYVCPTGKTLNGSNCI